MIDPHAMIRSNAAGDRRSILAHREVVEKKAGEGVSETFPLPFATLSREAIAEVIS
jgi:hypothetical protein